MVKSLSVAESGFQSSFEKKLASHGVTKSPGYAFRSCNAQPFCDEVPKGNLNNP